MWNQFSFKEKSLASFNFSFLHLPCYYMHIFFYLKDLGFGLLLLVCFFFCCFFNFYLYFYLNLFFTPLERTFSITFWADPAGYQRAQFSQRCSSASFITEWIPLEWKCESATPTALNIPCHWGANKIQVWHSYPLVPADPRGFCKRYHSWRQMEVIHWFSEWFKGCKGDIKDVRTAQLGKWESIHSKVN